MCIHLSFFQLAAVVSNIKDINYCEPDPCTHGRCIDGVSSYMCVCDPGYTGSNCNKGTTLEI